MHTVITLLLVGLSVGLDNFAASIAIGLGGVDKKLRLRIALIFGLFETAMPLIGLLIGKQVAGPLGSHANLVGGGLLIATGLYFVVSTSLKTDEAKIRQAADGWQKLLLSGLSISIDNLIVGFGLGARNIPILGAVLAIGLCSVSLALLGLEVGERIGHKVEQYSELLSGVILACVGLAIATKLL